MTMTTSPGIVMSTAEVANYLGGVVKGNPELQLAGFKPLNVAGSSDLSFLHLGKYRNAALMSNAGAIIVNAGVELGNQTLIVVSEATEAYRRAIDLFYPELPITPGVSPNAIVDPSAVLGVDVQIGPGAILAAGVTVGDRVSVMAGAIIGEGCSIGRDSCIHSGAVLYPGVVIGERVAIYANAVIGADGFSFRQSPDGKHQRIRQVGRLVIEDDVEIGACACIDRAALTETRIGKGCKIDKFVFISHNVQLGPDCIVMGQSAVAGSTSIGAGSILCMQTGVREHLVLGEDTTVMARGFVVADTPPKSVVAGVPAMPAAQWRKVVAITKRLPEIFGFYRKQMSTSRSASDLYESTNK
jgi:UDP-3-O-[3-hydroxymyristoyl] glucosamine N-acyltransferase